MAIDGRIQTRICVWAYVLFIGLVVPTVAVAGQQDPGRQPESLSQRLRAEPAEALARAARQKGDAVRGAILFTRRDLSCTRCHVPGAARPIGPDLTQLASDVTDAYLVESLLEPSKAVRKGFESVTVVTTDGKSLSGRLVEDGPRRLVIQVSTGDLERVTLPRSEIEEISPNRLSAMPDNLVDRLADRKQFLDIVRYLMELSSASARPAARGHVTGGQSIPQELQGIVLLREFNCSACHADDVTDMPLSAKRAPDLVRSAGLIDPHFVRRFIAAPLTVKPGTTMPDVMSGLPEAERQAAATEITHYLTSLSDQSFQVQPVDAGRIQPGRDLFHTVGCVACHSPRDDRERELLPESSVPMGQVQDKYSRDGLVAFLKDPLEIRPSGRMPNMQLTHQEAVDLASYLLSPPRANTSSAAFTPDDSLAARGKARFVGLGCVQCHQVGSVEPVQAPASMPLSKLRPDRGCLSGRSGAWPQFGLSSSQREAIQASLRQGARQLSPQEQIGITLTAFRCINCHQRDELGGVSAERDSHFQTADANLGPQGRIPPPLTGVGAKLKPRWMRQVLVSGRTIRPYVLTRMPQYGTSNIAQLVELFQQTDHLPPVEYPSFEDQKEIKKIGAEMVGTGGLNCIVCHTFQLKQAANMPAVDLTEMAERLKKDWFYHYMRDPQRLSQNTIMPSFWPGGRAMRRDILDGNRDLQIEALWQYLLDGRQARTPRGLIREPIELLATDEAVMLRRSYRGVGKRGIGVGYPHQVNLVFDAEQMRLAMIWKGRFADPSGVWRSQGHGTVRPLGSDLMTFAPGPDLDDAQNPWIVDDGRPPQHRFRGYSLDDVQRPRFRYEFADVQVEDYFVDALDEPGNRPLIRRTVVLKSQSDRTNLSFRAATGKSIRRLDEHEFLVDDRLKIRIDDSHTGTIVGAADVAQLRIPLTLVDGAARLVLEYRW